MILRTKVTVVMRTRRGDGAGGWARDVRGDAVYDETRTEVKGCSVQPAGTAERAGNGRDQVSADFTIYGPPTWPGDATSAVEIAGVRHEIVGEPQRWTTRRDKHVVVQVRRTSG